MISVFRNRPYRGRDKLNANRSFQPRKIQNVKKTFVPVKKCRACREVGEPFIGHEIRNCPNVMPSDRENLMQSFNLEVDEEEKENFQEDVDSANISVHGDQLQKSVDVDRVNIGESPKFNVKLSTKN